MVKRLGNRMQIKQKAGGKGLKFRLMEPFTRCKGFLKGNKWRIERNSYF